LSAGRQRGAQPALGALGLASGVAGAQGVVGLPGRPPVGGDVGQRLFGVAGPALQQHRHCQVPADEVPQQPVVLSDLRQGSLGERDGAVGVTVLAGEFGVQDRQHRGDVGVPAGRGAGRSLAGGIGIFGVGEQGFHLVDAAADECPDGSGQAQPRPGMDQLGGQRRQPAVHRGALAALEALLGVLLDQPGGPVDLPGGQSVAHGLIDQPVGLQPGGRIAVERWQPVGMCLMQAGAQQVGEQPVVAPPAAFLVQRDQEQVGPLDLLQPLLAVGLGGDGVAQRSRELVKDRRLQQEPHQLVGLPGEDLLG
jgi:hypothetical protein